MLRKTRPREQMSAAHLHTVLSAAEQFWSFPFIRARLTFSGRMFHAADFHRDAKVSQVDTVGYEEGVQ